MSKIKIDAITTQSEDFAQWYTDVCRKAELMDYSEVKGFIIYRPYGYAICENIQKYLDEKFKEKGHDNVYMPLVIPTSLFQKEKDHIEGFAPETLVATQGGNQKIEDPLIIRPTSEVLFCDHYAKIVSSYRDLPKKYNQWCSVVRWEKTTRPFLRGSEFLWQEGHTIHETEVEARTHALDMLKVYENMGKELLAIPFLTGTKTEKEKFAGAEQTFTIEALMPDGKALQCGTTHYFGDGFARVFNIQFQDRNNTLQYVHQTSFGVSTRLIGSVIMAHGDDNGLSLPPRLAPVQVIIVPIQQNKPGIMPKALELVSRLKSIGVRVKIDDSDKSPGWKFSEHEMKGIPLRLEIGPRDLKAEVLSGSIRHSHEKISFADKDLEEVVPALLEKIHEDMYQKKLTDLLNHTIEVRSIEELEDALNNKLAYAKMMWSGDQEDLDVIKEKYQATARALPFNQTPFAKKCLISGKPAKYVVIIARAY